MKSFSKNAATFVCWQTNDSRKELRGPKAKAYRAFHHRSKVMPLTNMLLKEVYRNPRDIVPSNQKKKRKKKEKRLLVQTARTDHEIEPRGPKSD